MVQRGGEADKLGNRFEGIWSVKNLLGLIAGDPSEIVFEPLGKEGLGVEFKCTLLGNIRQYHSVKAQRSSGEWSPAELCAKKRGERSILGDLVAKQVSDDCVEVVFVSSTSASRLQSFIADARRASDVDNFRQRIASNKGALNDFQRHILPLFCHDAERALDGLRHLKIVVIDEDTLTRNVDELISLRFRYPRGMSSKAVRLILADCVLSHLGSSMSRAALVDELAQENIHPIGASSGIAVGGELVGVETLSEHYVSSSVWGSENEKESNWAAIEAAKHSQMVAQEIARMQQLIPDVSRISESLRAAFDLRTPIAFGLRRVRVAVCLPINHQQCEGSTLSVLSTTKVDHAVRPPDPDYRVWYSVQPACESVQTTDERIVHVRMELCVGWERLTEDWQLPEQRVIDELVIGKWFGEAVLEKPGSIFSHLAVQVERRTLGDTIIVPFTVNIQKGLEKVIVSQIDTDLLAKSLSVVVSRGRQLLIDRIQ